MAQRIRTDWILFFTIVAMVSFGLVIVYSASSIMAEVKYHWSWYFITRQFGWALFSFLLLTIMKRMDYRRLQTPAFAFMPLGVVLSMLALVYVMDPKVHRWFRFGGIGIQPSEFAKPALIVFLAYFITHRLRAINDRHTLLPAGMALGLLAFTVAAGDFGTALILFITAASLFYVAGLDRRFVTIGAATACLVAVGFIAAKPYRVARLVGHFDPDYYWIESIDPTGIVKDYVSRSMSTRDPSYQAKQSKIAVGTGGVLGVGLMQGKQKLLYLPEAHTDFVYAVVGEELGLWGSTAVLIGFFIICWRGLRLFFIAPDPFGRYLALGVTVSIMAQALINMSVVLGMGPTKGFPLPMISYGGSSLLATLISLGMLLSVSERSG